MTVSRPASTVRDVRATLLTNIPTPYRAAFYGRVHRTLEAGGGGLTVVYGAMRQSDRQWSDAEPPTGDAPFAVVRRAQVRYRGRITYVNPAAARTVARTRPDVVVLSGFAPWTYSVALWCAATRTPFIVWSGETLASEQRLCGRRRMRRLPLLRGARRLIAYGPAAREYMLDTGVAADRVTVLGNGIDMEAYAARVDRLRSQRQAVRARFGFANRTILTMGGKNLAATLAAADMLSEPAQVAVVGQEPPDPHRARLVTLGRRSSEEMPGIYAMCDCLVHVPFADRWPHAVNEALTAGVPVVASPHTGVPDEALTGPGCAIVPLRTELIARGVERALQVAATSDAGVREEIRSPLRPWSVDRMSERFVAALRSARGG